MADVLNPSAQVLSAAHDVLLMDLDGVVYIGKNAVPFAAASLRRCETETESKIVYVTNNASRPPGAVVQALSSVGVVAGEDQIVTSAQVAAARLAQDLDQGAPVLVVGGEGLEVALHEVGLVAVRALDDDPVAVVQGFHPDIGWRDLAQAAGALHRGLPWVASNADMTLPTELGIAPGNGALIGALAQAVGRYPVVVGKPYSPALVEAVARTQARSPLVVGDRLDTDIEAAHAAAYPSLLVLTGVTSVPEVCLSSDVHRPDYICRDLRGLLENYVGPTWDGDTAQLAGWELVLGSNEIDIRRRGDDPIDGVRVLAAASWRQRDAGRSLGTPATELAEKLQVQIRGN